MHAGFMQRKREKKGQQASSFEWALAGEVVVLGLLRDAEMFPIRRSLLGFGSILKDRQCAHPPLPPVCGEINSREKPQSGTQENPEKNSRRRKGESPSRGDHHTTRSSLHNTH